MSRRKRRRRLFILLAVGIGLLGALLSAEILLRLYVAGRGWTSNCYATGLTFFVPDPNAGHTLRPGLRLKSSTYNVSVNSLGLRGAEIKRAKPRGVIRIAVLGGSSVFGYLVPDGEDSCRQLEQILESAGYPIEVLNGGVPGFNMRQARERLEHQIAPLEPDIVLLYLGWNDTRFLIAEDPNAIEKTPPAPPWGIRLLARSVLYGFVRYRLFPPPAPQFAPPSSAEVRVTQAGAESFQQDLLTLIATIRETGAIPVISTQLMAGNPGCEGLDGYLGESPRQVAANRQLCVWICNELRSTAKARDLLLIDCAAELPCNAEVLGDAIHLTAAGHRLVAEKWSEALEPVLSESLQNSAADQSTGSKDEA